MSATKVARRYARAVFQLASERDAGDAVRADCQALERMLKDSAEFAGVVQSPVLPPAEQQRVLRGLLDGHAHPLTLQFLCFLAQKGRLVHLGAICTMYETLYCDRNGILKAMVTSTVALTPEQTQSIHTRLEQRFQRTIEADSRVDPSLLGGFKVSIGDTILDFTIQAQLARLRRQCMNT
jgi:F-type H+-transporting ATPase subunit delta